MLEEFGDEPRNLRLGLGMDGMSPYRAFSSLKNDMAGIFSYLQSCSVVMHETKVSNDAVIDIGPETTGE